MKSIINILLLSSALALFACRQHQPHQSSGLVSEQEVLSSKPDTSYTSQPSSDRPGEKVTPTFEGNLIKVNNKLCAVSRTLMDEKTLGTFKGQVAYEGNNPQYIGKIFEFNYCCAMCQNMFPNKFKKDPDSILKFHGL